MIIKISNLSDGSYNYDFEGGVVDIGLEEPYTGRYETKVELSKFQDQIILNSETKIKAGMVCDRCSERYDKVIKSEYKMVYLLRGAEEENESIDIVYLNADTDKNRDKRLKSGTNMEACRRNEYFSGTKQANMATKPANRRREKCALI